MSTITLEIRDDLAARLAAMDPERLQRFAVAVLEREEMEDADPNAWFDNLTPEEQQRHLAELDASIAAADAGRTVPGHVVHQRLREKYGTGRR